MSTEDFAASVQALSSPFSDAGVRHAADKWLTGFKESPGAWPVLHQVLGSKADIPLRLHAAQALAWKTKKQIAQIPLPEHRQALLEATVALLAGAPAPGEGAVARALCVALANLVIHSTEVARPLEHLGGLNQAVLLEFLTILPGECNDAAQAAQAAPAEASFQLKQRVQDWSGDVCTWLHSMHAAALQAPSNLAAMPRQPTSLQEAIVLSNQPTLELTAAVVRCFGAWVSRQCLFFVEPPVAEYLVRASFALLLCGGGHEEEVAVGVDAATDVLEYAPHSMRDMLCELSVQLPARVVAAVGRGLDPGQLAHVFALFCSTNAALACSSGPRGEALRAGLLQLLSLPPHAAEVAATPAVDAVEDLLEAALLGSDDGEKDSPRHSHTPMEDEEALQFAAALVAALLMQLQPGAAALQVENGASRLPSPQAEEHSVLENLRSEAQTVVELCASRLSPATFVQQLHSAVEAAHAAHPSSHLPAAAALDATLCMLRSASTVFTQQYHCAGRPPPEWFPGLLALYFAVPSFQGNARCPAGTATLLQYDLLTSFVALAPAIMPVLRDCSAECQQGLLHLITQQCTHALFCQHQAPPLHAGSDMDARMAAADAMRALCSFAAAAQMPTSIQLLLSLDTMASALQGPQHQRQYHSAQQQLVVAFVHAVHAAPDGNASLAAAAQALYQRRCLDPFGEGLAALQQALLGAPPGESVLGVKCDLQSAAARVQASLRQLQAMLNAFESYADGYEHGGDSEAYGGHAVARAVLHTAVGAFLAAWPILGTACSHDLAEPLFADISQCLCSLIALVKGHMEGQLPTILPPLSAAFALPGGHALHPVLCAAVEAYGGQGQLQPLLLHMVHDLLGSAHARAFTRVRGGDADPPAALALLSLGNCVLREATRWAAVPEPPAVAAVAEQVLQLAAANAPCNHRDTSQRAVAALSSVVVVAMGAGEGLQDTMLGFADHQGSLIVQGLLLALLSLNSAAHLPKVVSLMSDVAVLATTTASPSPGGDAEALWVLSGAVLRRWLAAARESLVSAAVLPAEVLDAVVARWDWAPVLQLAALQATAATQGGGSRAAMAAELRRTTQRAVRQLASEVGRAGVTLQVS